MALKGPSLFPLMRSSVFCLPVAQSKINTVGFPGQKALLFASFMPPTANSLLSLLKARLRTPPTSAMKLSKRVCKIFASNSRSNFQLPMPHCRTLP